MIPVQCSPTVTVVLVNISGQKLKYLLNRIIKKPYLPEIAAIFPPHRELVKYALLYPD